MVRGAFGVQGPGFSPAPLLQPPPAARRPGCSRARSGAGGRGTGAGQPGGWERWAGGAASDGSPSQEERCPGGALGAFLPPSWSSPGSVAAGEQSPGKSDGKLDAPGGQPTLREGSRGAGCCSPRRRLPTRGASCGVGQLRPRPPSIWTGREVRGVGARGLRDVHAAGCPIPPLHGATHPLVGEAKARRGRISSTRAGSGGHRCRAG